MSLGERIKTLRKQEGLTQQELADSVGFTQSALAQIERGDCTTTIRNLNKMAFSLGVPPYELLCDDEELSGIKNALGKQRPVKHHHTMLVRADDTVRISICPVCLGVVISNGSQYPNYCTWCGQAIDWSDRTEEEDMP